MLSENLQLLIIGGPNGAGKSTYSKDLSYPGATIFDADKVLARIEARFPDIPKESIHFAARQEFLDQVDDAIRHKRHFTIETNFRDYELMETVAHFKRNGYTTNMLYLTLENIELSIDRVKERVSDGGHFVDLESIYHNFDEGLNYLEYFADRFDNLEIIDASVRQELQPLLSIRQRKVELLSNELPERVAKTINAIADQCRQVQNKKLRQRLGPHL
jgi:predicted ABC-type ATPase